MRKICDEVFGETNFIACVIWQKIHSIKNDAKYFSENDYPLIYRMSDNTEDDFELENFLNAQKLRALHYKNVKGVKLHVLCRNIQSTFRSSET